MEIKKLILRSNLSSGGYGYISYGWGNGYVGVPPDHPWHGKSYGHELLQDISVHGGLTWASDYAPRPPTIDDPSPRCSPGYWWFGFDTAHLGDTEYSCPKSYVEAETERLYQQACVVYDPVQIREDTNHRKLDADL